MQCVPSRAFSYVPPPDRRGCSGIFPPCGLVCLLQGNSLAVGQVGKSYRGAQENGGQTISDDKTHLCQDPKGTTGAAITTCNFGSELIIVATVVEQHNHHLLLEGLLQSC